MGLVSAQKAYEAPLRPCQSRRKGRVTPLASGVAEVLGHVALKHRVWSATCNPTHDWAPAALQSFRFACPHHMSRLFDIGVSALGAGAGLFGVRWCVPAGQRCRRVRNGGPSAARRSMGRVAEPSQSGQSPAKPLRPSLLHSFKLCSRRGVPRHVCASVIWRPSATALAVSLHP